MRFSRRTGHRNRYESEAEMGRQTVPPLLITALLFLVVVSVLGCTGAVNNRSSSADRGPTDSPTVSTSLGATTEPTSAAQWKFSAKDLTLEEMVYLRQIGTRIYLLADPAWTLGESDIVSLLKEDAQGLDKVRFENAASFARLSYAEVDGGTAPTARLDAVRVAFAQVLLPLAQALEGIESAAHEMGSEKTSSWVSQYISANRGLLDFSKDLKECGAVKWPPLPAKDELTSKEMEFAEKILMMGVWVEGSMIEVQQAVEAGGTPQGLAARLSGPKRRLEEAQAEWRSVRSPSDRLYEIRQLWNLVLGYAVAGVEVLSDGGENAQSCVADARVLLRLAGVFNKMVCNAVKQML